MATFIWSRRFVSRRCQLLLFVTAACLLPAVLQGHSHSHDHDEHGHSHDEPASFKYSRKANQAPPTDGHVVVVAPDEKAEDRHAQEHGHAHDHHGHAHDHGHSHDHGHAHGGNGHAHGHHGHSHTKPGETKKGIEEFEKLANINKQQSGGGPDFTVWLKALGATAFISVAPICILYFVPLYDAKEQHDRLKVLLSFASGGLLGDAFLHLIPHAISPHSHSHGESEGDHGHSHESHGHSHEHHSHDMGVGLWVLGGIVAFLIVEKFVRFVKEGSDEHGHSHAHGHSHGAQKPATDVKTDEKKTTKTDETKSAKTDEKKTDETKASGEDKTKSPKKPKKAKDSDEEQEDDEEIEEEKGKGDSEGDKEGEEDQKSEKKVEEKTFAEKDHVHGSDIKVAGYLNLAADFAHNFTDGLAIGASFLGGNTLGMITTATIFLHEIPHEIGDFAILMQSGCTKQRAMMLQFSTAIGAMLGTLCSLVAGGVGVAAIAWILPFTAGGFIYIATVSVIPELLEETKISQSVKEIAALLFGVYMMVLIAQYE